MAGRKTACAAVLGCLVGLGLALAAAAEHPAQELPTTELNETASSVSELLGALNRTQGSDKSITITLLDDIYISPQDIRAWQPWLPFNGGNRTTVLRGAGRAVVLDFGRVVNLVHHPEGHTAIFQNLVVQGMAPAAAGLAAGLPTQMVAAPLWPSTSGDPGHWMVFRDCQIRTIAASCSANSTAFSMRALQQLAGSYKAVTRQDDLALMVGPQLNYTIAVRNLTTGDQIGNIDFSMQNVLMACSPATTNNSQASIAMLSANQTAPTGVAGSPDEFLLLLATPTVTRIVLGAHINLRTANWSRWSPQLPLQLRKRNVEVLSNDASLRTLDLDGQPQLLFVAADSGLTFNRVHLQGIAPASAVLASRSTSIPGSPLWPTVDGESGHRLSLEGSVVHAIVTPCSARSNNITVQLIQQILGPDGARLLNGSGYVVLPRWGRQEPIIDVLTKHEVGFGLYYVTDTIMECEEDDAIVLAAELQLSRGTLARQTASNDTAAGSSASTSSGSGSGSGQRWLLPVLAAGAASCAVGLAAMAFLLRRRRQGAHSGRAAAAAAPAAGTATDTSQQGGDKDEAATHRASRMHRMESGDGQVEPVLDAAAGLSSAVLGPGTASHGTGTRTTTSRAGSAPLDRAMSAEGWHGDPLFRCRLGVIEGLEVGELLGRGAYGRVYKGRWNGAIVAVKVVEHTVAPNGSTSCCSHGGCETCGSNALAREPLLCMSVSHPNCVATYKLSMVRLLRGEGLVEPDQSVQCVEAAAAGGLMAVSPSGPAGSSSAFIAEAPRHVHSLLSGAEGVEVADPYGPLAPGLYETWMVLEYCDRGSLADALGERRLVGKDGRPHMVAVLLCLLDVASGMSYLHSLGIVHGDLKPANVLLKGVRSSVRGFQCKLGDFGLSRMLDGRATHVQTGSLGTPTHAAPELLREGRLATPVDVYAFGVLAWELVAGEEAWRGQHPMHIILQVTQQGARPPPLPNCPPRLAAVMEACWHEDPARRPRFAALLPQLQEMLQAARWQAKQAREPAMIQPGPEGCQPDGASSQSAAASRRSSLDTNATVTTDGSTAPLLRTRSIPPMARAASMPQRAGAGSTTVALARAGSDAALLQASSTP